MSKDSDSNCSEYEKAQNLLHFAPAKGSLQSGSDTPIKKALLRRNRAFLIGGR
jgi:hypothetical protein